MEPVRYEWDEAKRVENLEKHGIDFTRVLRLRLATAVDRSGSATRLRRGAIRAYGRMDGVRACACIHLARRACIA